MNLTLNKKQIERFSRQIILKNIGTIGQKKIIESKVLIIGMGGLGCPVAEFLARAGVGSIGIIDSDKVDLSNIHRQSLYDVSDLKKSKVLSAKKKLKKINSKIKVTASKNNWFKFAKGWIYKNQVKPIKYIEKDPFKIIKIFKNIKYKWGGKSYKGIDCSALLQLFYYYNDIFYPRDTKDQIKYSRRKLKRKVFKKGDVIFWKGHVAMCINSKKLIHAYGPEKKVLIMPIIKTIERIKRTANLSVKKISSIKY